MDKRLGKIRMVGFGLGSNPLSTITRRPTPIELPHTLHSISMQALESMDRFGKGKSTFLDAVQAAITQFPNTFSRGSTNLYESILNDMGVQDGEHIISAEEYIQEMQWLYKLSREYPRRYRKAYRAVLTRNITIAHKQLAASVKKVDSFAKASKES